MKNKSIMVFLVNGHFDLYTGISGDEMSEYISNINSDATVFMIKDKMKGTFVYYPKHGVLKIVVREEVVQTVATKN